MKIFQRNIIGGGCNISTEKERKSSVKASPVKKEYPTVTLEDGLDNKNAEANAMLYHRMLQKKVIFSGIKTKEKQDILTDILCNEMKIKNGDIDALTATRDSLLRFFTKK